MQKTKQRHADMSWRHSPRGGYRTSIIYRRRSIFVLVVVLSAGRCYHIFAGGRAPLFFADAGMRGCANGSRRRERLRVFCADFGAAAWRICVLSAEGRRVFCADAGIVCRAFCAAIRTARRTHAAALRFACEWKQAALAAANRRVTVPRHM